MLVYPPMVVFWSDWCLVVFLMTVMVIKATMMISCSFLYLIAPNIEHDEHFEQRLGLYIQDSSNVLRGRMLSFSGLSRMLL